MSSHSFLLFLLSSLHDPHTCMTSCRALPIRCLHKRAESDEMRRRHEVHTRNGREDTCDVEALRTRQDQNKYALWMCQVSSYVSLQICSLGECLTEVGGFWANPPSHDKWQNDWLRLTHTTHCDRRRWASRTFSICHFLLIFSIERRNKRERENPLHVLLNMIEFSTTSTDPHDLTIHPQLSSEIFFAARKCPPFFQCSAV